MDTRRRLTIRAVRHPATAARGRHRKYSTYSTFKLFRCNPDVMECLTLADTIQRSSTKRIRMVFPDMVTGPYK